MNALVVIELDGNQHAAQALYDADRDAFLRSNGFRVLRFWNNDVFSQTDFIVKTIHETLHAPPPPCDGGGRKIEESPPVMAPPS
jgi:very-short-patch-repair endonuclease